MYTVRNFCIKLPLHAMEVFFSNLIVYYVPRCIMRVITRRATMLAGDRSQGVGEVSRPVTSYMYLFIILRFHNKNYMKNMFRKILIVRNRMYDSKIVIGREK